MLLSISGASGSGKSTVLDALAALEWGGTVSFAEFDSVGVPEGADAAWRYRTVEHWIRYALAEHAAGRDVVLAGQIPPGELLAAPSSDRLDGIAVCVLDCSAETRASRLRRRGDPESSISDHVAFGGWFRAHAADPQHRPEVIRVETGVPMRWDRWADWSAGDARWPVTVIDTDGATLDDAVCRVAAWVRGRLDGPRPGAQTPSARST